MQVNDDGGLLQESGRCLSRYQDNKLIMTSFDNNENKVCLLLKDNVGGSRVRSHAKSHDFGSHNHGVLLANFLLFNLYINIIS